MTAKSPQQNLHAADNLALPVQSAAGAERPFNNLDALKIRRKYRAYALQVETLLVTPSMELLAARGTDNRLLFEVFVTGHGTNDSSSRFQYSSDFCQSLPHQFHGQMLDYFRNDHGVKLRVWEWDVLDV